MRRSLDDDKAEDVVVIDLKGKSAFADYMVIASGRSNRQVVAIAEHLADRLKQAGHGYIPVEGKQTGDWVLVDGGDVVVHIFRPEPRAFYALEKMWALENEAAAKPKPRDAAAPRAQDAGVKLTIACIGRAGRGPERDLYEHYADRIRWPLALRELEEKKKLPPAAADARARASCCWSAAPAGAVLVALDRRGKVLDSQAFADRLGALARQFGVGRGLPDRRRRRPCRAPAEEGRPRRCRSAP